MINFRKKPKDIKQKKQVIVDTSLYNKVKGKMVAEGSTFSYWLEEKMKEELHGE